MNVTKEWQARSRKERSSRSLRSRHDQRIFVARGVNSASVSLFAVWSEESSPMGNPLWSGRTENCKRVAICLSKIAARCRAAIVVVPRLFIGWRMRWRREERVCGPAGAPQSLHRQISLHFSLKASISSVCVPSNTPRCLLFSSCFLLSLILFLSPLPAARFHGLSYF